VSYELTCTCGRSVRGERGRRHQVVPCPVCGRPLFVLPRSPWLAPPPTGPRPRGGGLRPWRGPLLAGFASAAVLAAGFLVALPYLGRDKPDPPEDVAPAVRERVRAGQKALAEGQAHRALRELNAAVGLRDRQPGGLSPGEHRRLNQLQRQADLLVRLSRRSLEEILRDSARVRHDEEWEAQFKDDRGKTVVFDDVVGRDDAGRPALRFYAVHLDKPEDKEPVTARVALEDLALLRDLPLATPCRLLFGARLASCRGEKGGAWVVRFQPDSAVLLTDPDVAAACCPAPLDRDLLEALDRQRRWLDHVGDLRPAPP
jgi:hypothetical protein